VDLSNLQRQVLYTTDDVGKLKSDTARDKLVSINPEIAVSSHKLRLSAENVMETIAPYDLVIDGTDNFATRYLVNDACFLSGKPNVYGSIFRFEGQVSVFCSKDGPCYRCLFPTPPEPDAVPNCAEGGVLGVLAGVIGALQATEAIKLVLGQGKPLIGKLLLYNALDMEFHKLNVKKKKNTCPLCGEHPTITTPTDIEFVCAGEESSQSTTDDVTSTTLASEVEPMELSKMISSTDHRFILLDVRNDNEVALCRIPGAIHIPLPELERRLTELDKEKSMVVYCKSGVRSRQAISLLQQAGFTSLCNLKGGISAWASQIDPSMPRY
ncbi:MAG: ThiF family adenylyltransferase, partial [Cyanobacteria bacterium]|nr:ThiF family adenylyltransferase [Cyanobacteriota bacterium]